jgi:hypothetical protein
MAHREFTDSRQVTWQVWDVYPALGDRRGPFRDRRYFMREAQDRRTALDIARLPMNPAYARGWLAFQSAQEKRRLAPVPDAWEGLDGPSLERLCQAATPVGRPRRLIE